LQTKSKSSGTNVYNNIYNMVGQNFVACCELNLITVSFILNVYIKKYIGIYKPRQLEINFFCFQCNVSIVCCVLNLEYKNFWPKTLFLIRYLYAFDFFLIRMFSSIQIVHNKIHLILYLFIIIMLLKLLIHSKILFKLTY